MRSLVPAPRHGLGALGVATPAAGGARPRPGPHLVKLPAAGRKGAIFVSTFLTSWGLSKAGLPCFYLSPTKQSRGAEQHSHPKGVPLRQCVPYHATALQQRVPGQVMSPPLQRRVPLQRHIPPHPLSPSPQPLWESHAGRDRGVASKAGGMEGGSSHTPQLAPWAKPLLGASVQLLKIESENIWVLNPDGRGGCIPAPPAARCPGVSPPTLLPSQSPPPVTLSPAQWSLSPRSGWIPLGSLGELLQRLAQILHKRKNSRQVALPNLVIPSPAALTAPSAAISSPRSPLRGGDREERFCLGKHHVESTLHRPLRAGLSQGPPPATDHHRPRWSRGYAAVVLPKIHGGNAHPGECRKLEGQAPKPHFLPRSWSRGSEA